MTDHLGDARYKAQNASLALLGRVADHRLITDLIFAVRHQMAEEIREFGRGEYAGWSAPAALDQVAASIDPFVYDPVNKIWKDR